MDRKTFGIGILSVTALILFVATLLPAPAKAAFGVKDLQGWQLQAVSSQNGGDALFVIDPTGKVIVLAYDPVQKVMKPVGSGELSTILVGK